MKLALLCFFLLPLFAQAQEDPKSFFEGNYADAPFDNRTGIFDQKNGTGVSPDIRRRMNNVRQEIERKKKNGGIEAPGASGDGSLERSPSGFFDFTEELLAEPTPESQEASEEDQELDEFVGEQVYLIDLIVNALEEEHVKKVMDEFALLRKSNSLAAGVIYAVGFNPRAVVRHSWFQLSPNSDEGISVPAPRVKFLRKPPDKYRVTRSPVYILHTEKGEIVVEGVEGISHFFDGKGRFIDRSLGLMEEVK